MSAAAQHEITKPSPLLDDSGALVQTGWARRPLLDCNMENARTVGFRPLQRFRAKRWDYFGGAPLHAELRFALATDHESTVIVRPTAGKAGDRDVVCQLGVGSAVPVRIASAVT